jgi:hypothetical protein
MKRQLSIGLAVMAAFAFVYLGCGSSGSSKSDGTDGGDTDGSTDGAVTGDDIDAGSTDGDIDAGSTDSGIDAGSTDGGIDAGSTDGDTTGDVVAPPPDTGPKPEPEINDHCGEALNCYFTCPPNDPNCQPACLADLSIKEKQSFDDFLQCVTTNRAACQQTANPNQCLLDACAAEFFSCIVGEGGDSNCGEFALCTDACQTSEDSGACEEECLSNISKDGFTVYLAYSNCVVGECPAAPGQAPDPQCVQNAQMSPNGVCYGKLEDCVCGDGETPYMCADGQCAASAEECGAATTEGGTDTGTGTGEVDTGSTDEGSADEGTTDDGSTDDGTTTEGGTDGDTTGSDDGGGSGGSSKPGAQFKPLGCAMAAYSKTLYQWFFVDLKSLF